MTGIFDSGMGGIATARELRKLLPREDIILLCDRANAPYGVRTRAELINIATENIRHLMALGVGRVLIGCCTASTVYPYLDSACQEAAIPIIAPTADAAASATNTGKIGIIATEATIKSGAFGDALRARGCKEITEAAMQWLVGAVEGGLSDESFTEYDIKRLEDGLRPIKEGGADTLILGCTHFPAVSGLIHRILGEEVRLISSAYEGAKILKTNLNGVGRSITKYIAT